MPHSTPPPERTAAGTALLRAVRFRCPACGQGRLYRAYLKPVEACAACGAPLGQVPSEDGPPWLTVLFLGPFLVGVTFLITRSGLSPWLTLPIAAVAVIGAVMLALPFVKAAWIGVLWSMGKVGESQE